MTIMDKLNAYSRSIVQAVVDKEAVNYYEASALYGAVIQGKVDISLLSVFYKFAQDSGLKKMIGEAIDQIMVPAIKHCESLLRDGEAEIPTVNFPAHPLYTNEAIPEDLRLTDMEVALAVGNLVKAYQYTLFLALEQSYQLEIARALAGLLSAGVDWEYRFLQLMIHNKWLPVIPKVVKNSSGPQRHC